MFKLSLDELMAALCARFHRRQNTNTGGEGGCCKALHLPRMEVSLRWEQKAGWDLGHHHQLGQLCASSLGHGPTQDTLHPSPGVVSWYNKRGKPFGSPPRSTNIHRWLWNLCRHGAASRGRLRVFLPCSQPVFPVRFNYFDKQSGNALYCSIRLCSGGVNEEWAED